jgi:uncharacterized HAD superfamily protein
MGLKEQVKQGKIAVAEAIVRVSESSKTYSWLKRRAARTSAQKGEK